LKEAKLVVTIFELFATFFLEDASARISSQIPEKHDSEQNEDIRREASRRKTYYSIQKSTLAHMKEQHIVLYPALAFVAG
jgi:hypothetical protein